MCCATADGFGSSAVARRDSLTVPWNLVNRRSRVEVAPPNNVLFLENLPTDCTETMLSMLFQSAAHTDALSPRSARHTPVGIRWNDNTSQNSDAHFAQRDVPRS